MMLDIGRDSAVAGAVILIAIVAIALSAATIASVEGGDIGIDTGVSDPPSGEDPRDDDDFEPGEPNKNGEIQESDPIVDLQICVTELQTTEGILAVLLGVIAVLGIVNYLYNASTALLTATAIIPPVFGGYFFLTNCPGGGPGSGLGISTPSPSTGAGGGGIQSLPIPPEAIVVGLALLTGLAVAMVYTSTRGDETFEPVTEDEEPDADAADFADAAGRAADRIEEANVPVDNAVYRAWVEMTTLLNMPNPESKTPKDFAEEAIEFGLDEDAVSELTELFVEVRYGGESPENREDRAVEILRDFQAEYSDDTSEERR